MLYIGGFRFQRHTDSCSYHGLATFRTQKINDHGRRLSESSTSLSSGHLGRLCWCHDGYETWSLFDIHELSPRSRSIDGQSTSFDEIVMAIRLFNPSCDGE